MPPRSRHGSPSRPQFLRVHGGEAVRRRSSDRLGGPAWGLRPILILSILWAACSTTTRVSEDPETNYAWTFAEMPAPKPEIVHSRVERQDPVVFFGFVLPPRNGEWEFELVADRSWIDALRKGFLQIPWADIRSRPNIPPWFSPDPVSFMVSYLPDGSGRPAVHLFIEKEPLDPDRIRVFIRRH